MRCEAMRAVISEEQCVRNQETLAAKKAKCKNRTWFGFYSHCENCDLGKEVRERVEARMAEEGPKAVETGEPVAAEDVFDGIDAGRVTKRCSKCGQELPRSEFYKDKHAKDKLYGQCKECSRKNTKIWKDREREERQRRTGKAPAVEADAIPEERERASLVIEVDFSRVPDVLERLQKDAEEELRTVSAQALWVLREWNTEERGEDRWHEARERLADKRRAAGAEE